MIGLFRILIIERSMMVAFIGGYKTYHPTTAETRGPRGLGSAS